MAKVDAMQIAILGGLGVGGVLLYDQAVKPGTALNKLFFPNGTTLAPLAGKPSNRGSAEQQKADSGQNGIVSTGGSTGKTPTMNPGFNGPFSCDYNPPPAGHVTKHYGQYGYTADGSHWQDQGNVYTIYEIDGGHAYVAIGPNC